MSDILNLMDYNIKQYLTCENGANILKLDKEYDKINIDCLLPPRIDAVVPHQPNNGIEFHAYGKFTLYGKLVNEAHLMLWNRKWWNKDL